MCQPSAQPGKRTIQDVVHYYSVGLLLISIFLFGMDLTTTVLWIYSFGTGMVVGIFGIATGSMGISFSKIKDEANFKLALKKVMTMAWVTISFSFCIFFWIVVALGMFIDNHHCSSYYYCHKHYPYAYIGELLCFMIQWGFLFYLINMLGSPCQCCCYTETFLDSPQVVQQALQPAFVPVQNQVLAVQPALQHGVFPQNQAPVLIYQQPYGQQQLLQHVQPLQPVQQQQQPQQIVNQGQTNPAANIEENMEANAPSTSETKEQF